MILENELLKVEIVPEGAELRSVFAKNSAREYIWQRDPRFWAKSSPILFPIVGGLKNGRYQHNGQEYQLPKHGFARDSTFGLVVQTETELSFVLRADEKTKDMYPFEFDLFVHYILEEDRLYCTYEVWNNSEEEMVFSIGGHPALQLDFSNRKSWADYYLEFPDDNAVTRYYLKQGLLHTQPEFYPLQNQQLQLSGSMFQDDAWVLKNLASKKVRLGNRQEDYGVEFIFEGFPYLGLWSAPGSSFICLEPWCGVNDTAQHRGGLLEKEGIVSLSLAERWQRTWSLSVMK
ncbi:aldose 1-epimerase family protein [Sphingobacterium alkalisoli]|uniref:Aldose 1-epimerase family protein n=1 Tax=Sphingobacterium alkalisoli TaxID=1874115 RepID=A0A4U0GSJ6_9SPHI|nr:aldose 1-epimerase family protein [Sphingobacterium alkalisoli]TJY61434.1 aldose 1-epimerase family protein [Sphingobacterium alkalisoli]GGH30413.1 aldose 1-epimerase [Sphingobacterium alkalisoli]